MMILNLKMRWIFVRVVEEDQEVHAVWLNLEPYDLCEIGDGLLFDFLRGETSKLLEEHLEVLQEEMKKRMTFV